MKHFLTALLFLQIALFPTLASAAVCQSVDADTGTCMDQQGQQGTYKLMAPLFGEIGPGSSPDLTTYLQGVVQVTIGLAGILAVIMIVVCGIKLMGTSSVSGRSEAKECVWNAIFGVLLAVGAWVILFTINPLLLSKEVNLTEVANAPVVAPPQGPVTQQMPTQPGWYFKYRDTDGSIKYNPAGTSGATCAELLAAAERAGKTIVPLSDGRKCFDVPAQNVQTPPAGVGGTEAAVRTALCGNTSCVGSTPLGINTGPCPSVGSSGCTDVKGLGSPAIAHLRALPGACGSGCNVVISGGTEYWLHSPKAAPTGTHSPGNSVFDLQMSQKLNQYIESSAMKTAPAFNNFTRYRIKIQDDYWWYTKEGNMGVRNAHWHVCPEGASVFYCQNPQ